MSFMKSSLSLTVYTATPEFLANITPDRLKQCAFQSIDEIAEEKSYGFVNHDDMFDTDWTISVPEKGQYIAFGFRIDCRKIPSSVLKKHVAFRIENDRERGNKFISRARKAEIRDQCKAALLSKQEPQPTMYGVVVDPVAGLIYVTSTSKSVLETFETYMNAAFGKGMKHLYPDALGIESELFLESFMKELLEHGQRVTVNGVQYLIDELGTVTLAGQEKGVSVSVTDAPESVEAGLNAGLLPTSLTMQITTPVGENITFSINKMCAFSSLRTPRVPKELEGDPDAEFLIKMGYLETAVAVITTALNQRKQAA